MYLLCTVSLAWRWRAGLKCGVKRVVNGYIVVYTPIFKAFLSPIPETSHTLHHCADSLYKELGRVLLCTRSAFQKRNCEFEFKEKIMALRCVVLSGGENLLLPATFIVKIQHIEKTQPESSSARLFSSCPVCSQTNYCCQVFGYQMHNSQTQPRQGRS